MNLFRCLIVILVLFNLNIATAKTLSSAKTKLSQCEDTPVFNPVTQVESLPIHVKLAERATNYDQPDHNHISCQSAQFKYNAIRDNEQVQVVSTYKKNGHPHAQYIAIRDNKIGGGYRKHGVFSTFWSDGKKQSVEYFCDGFAVGFHQYFDKDGKLIYVADYTNSDYELNKRIGFGARLLFKEVYAVNNDEVVRKAFATAKIFSSSWIALDLTSSIEQWTKQGDQGTVMSNGRSLRVVNENFDYLPFSEVYQRHKQNLQGLRQPQSYHPEMLACPWIDEAMQLGLKDKRFKLKPVAAVSEQDIAATPQARYAACLAKPTTDCLFEQFNENLQFGGDRKEELANNFGRATLATGYPEWTRKAMIQALSETRGFRLPNPWFAEPASLNARAELALGLHQEAQQSIETAFENAFTEQSGYSPSCCNAITSSIPLILVNPKSVSIDKIRKFYNFAESNKIPTALAIVENAAIAQARQGNIEEAMRLADEFFPKDNPFTSLQIDKSKEYENADTGGRYNYLLALVALAEGQIKRGDLSAAQATLSQIEKLAPSYDKSTDVIIKIASIVAQVDDVNKAMNALEQVYAEQANNIGYLYMDDLANIPISLCKAGKKTEARRFVDRIRTATFDGYSANGKDKEKIKLTTDPYVEAHLARIALSCDDVKKATADFKDILKRFGDPVDCHGHFCQDLFGRADRIRQIALNAGLADLLWENKKDSYNSNSSFNLEVALQRAKNGDTELALARLDGLANVKNTQNEKHLVRAQILSLLGRDSEADKEFSKARQLGINDKYIEGQAYNLLEIAKAYIALKKNEQAIATINEVLSFTDDLDPLGRLRPDIIRMLAELGLDQQAESIALIELDSNNLNYLARRKEQELGRSQILAEVALNRFQQNQDPEDLTAFTSVQPLALRLSFWLKALNSAKQQQNDEGLAVINETLAKELDNLSISLDVGMDFPEKRQVIHYVAKILRANLANLSPEKQLSILEQLSQQARFISEYKEGAKALCELGYTAQQINQPALSKTLFADGAALAKKYYFTDKPEALGVCAFWLKTAGDTNQANALIDELIKQMPKNLETVGLGGIHTLLSVAIAYAEYEKGEVQWLDGSRLAP